MTNQVEYQPGCLDRELAEIDSPVRRRASPTDEAVIRIVPTVGQDCALQNAMLNA